MEKSATNHIRTVVAHFLKMNLITKEHLRIFDLYESNSDSLARVGTKKEKELFKNNNLFEKINELIHNQYLIKNKLASKKFSEELNIEIEKNLIDKSLKKHIDYLRKKYYEPEKEKSIFSSIMDILWAAFG